MALGLHWYQSYSIPSSLLQKQPLTVLSLSFYPFIFFLFFYFFLLAHKMHRLVNLD